MSEKSKVKINDTKLKFFNRLIENNKYYVKVGILGSSNKERRGGKEQLGNPEIGLKHEFGHDGMPVRSFLRMPLSSGRVQKNLERSFKPGDEMLNKISQETSLKPLMKVIGAIAEDIVIEAFETGGFGGWKESNMKYKKNHQTLVETTQLRRSISSEVTE